MKISIKRKLGFLHVRGGAVRRVVRAHQVSTRSLSQVPQVPDRGKMPPPRFPGGESFVTALPGDLVMDIVNVRSGDVIGYTYLSGAALQLNRYDGQIDVGSPLPTRDLMFPRPPGGDVDVGELDREATAVYLRSVLEFMLDARYTPAVLTRFGVNFEDPESAKRCGETLIDMLQYVPADGGALQTTHLIAVISGPDCEVTLHAQPPQDTSAWCATGFQAALVMTAPAAPAAP